MSYPPQSYQSHGGPPQGYQQPLPSQYHPQGYPLQQQGYGGPPQGYPPPGQYPPQPQGYPPQQHSSYPPQQHQSYPPQQHQGYPPQQHQGYPQQQQGYPSPQPPYGAPSHSPYPQQQPYGPPSHSPNPYGAPPPGQNGQLQHQNPSYGGAPPQAPYGAPPPQPYGAPAAVPTPPSPGYAPNHQVQYDARNRAGACRNAMHGAGTNEEVLISTLAHVPPTEISCLKAAFVQVDGPGTKPRDLIRDIRRETSHHFRDCLVSICRGPLQNDVEALHHGLNPNFAGAGTKEDWLNDILIGRSNADIHAIKNAYQATYRRSLESALRADLSLKTERLFMMILAGTRQEDSAPVLPQNVHSDVEELHLAIEGRRGTEQLTACSILSNRSDGQIRAIANEYGGKYGSPLEDVINKKFSSHMKDALLEIVRCGADRAKRDAIRLEACMTGFGTNDDRLVAVLTSVHWDRRHTEQVKRAYQAKYDNSKNQDKKDLPSRIRGETSGDYKRCLLAMID